MTTDTTTADPVLTQSLRDSIIDTLRRYGAHVTFAEVIKDAKSRGLPTEGDYALANDQMTPYNIIIWAGVSAEFFDALASLVEDRSIEYTPTTFLTYLCDGMALDLPLVKGRYRYKKPHWLPVCINKGTGWKEAE